jgi:hypothetical protein
MPQESNKQTEQAEFMLEDENFASVKNLDGTGGFSTLTHRFSS